MTDDLVRVLQELETGSDAATAELLPLVYEELRRLAEKQLARERPGATLQATALVHEAWLRLVGTDGAQGRARWDNAGHFFAAAATAMRRILVEKARARRAQKRGAGELVVAVDPDDVAARSVSEELLDLDAALTRFATEEPRKARVVELRFFAGLTLEQIAATLGVSAITVDRDWAFARAWLHDALRGNCGSG